MNNFVAQLFRLPFQTFALGMDVMIRSMESVAQIVGSGASGMVREGSVGLPGGAPAFDPRRTFSVQGSAADHVSVDVAAEDIETRTRTTQEDQKMSSCCSQDLSGCNEVKVIQYTVVNVNPYIPDSERILAGPEVIATTDDLTDADFTAWIIAQFIQNYEHGHHHHPFPHQDKQYLRVCYHVICRLAMPCTDYEKVQAEALLAIAGELRKKDDDEKKESLPAPSKTAAAKK